MIHQMSVCNKHPHGYINVTKLFFTYFYLKHKLLLVITRSMISILQVYSARAGPQTARVKVANYLASDTGVL